MAGSWVWIGPGFSLVLLCGGEFVGEQGLVTVHGDFFGATSIYGHQAVTKPDSLSNSENVWGAIERGAAQGPFAKRNRGRCLGLPCLLKGAERAFAGVSQKAAGAPAGRGGRFGTGVAVGCLH